MRRVTNSVWPISRLVRPDGEEEVRLLPAAPAEARALLSSALGDIVSAAESLGHIGVTGQIMRLADVMAAEGDTIGRANLVEESADVLPRRGVRPGVVKALRQQ